MDARLRALCDLMVPTARESVGRHEYDGVVQDLSPDGVRGALERLTPAGTQPYEDPHDEAHAVAAEEAARVSLGELELHRGNPLYHVANLDLACYDREYGLAAERAEARLAHLDRWPDAVDAAVTALDRVPAPVARATLSAARGLASQIQPGDGAAGERGLAAHTRFVDHLVGLTSTGVPETALGGAALARLLSAAEALPVELSTLAARADTERDRLRAMLDEACRRIAPGHSTADTVATLLADHPDIDGVISEAHALTAEVIEWTARHDLVPYSDGECRVGPAPESRRWAMAMMAWAAPYESDAASWYHVTPPEESWPAQEREEWLAVFSRTSLPAITVHEVAPGHFSHGRALRRAPSAVRRTLIGEAFVEGWAHYVEEMALEEGFHAEDPRFAAGVALEALVRVVRLSVAIGLHTGAMGVDEAARRFRTDAFLQGPAALAEAYRGTFDPTYGRYTWGKLAILALRERARTEWGAGFSLPRLHAALLDLGSPPLGLLDTAVQRG
ncbi:MAG: DUF885 family protein [Actinocatenispora sp.]